MSPPDSLRAAGSRLSSPPRQMGGDLELPPFSGSDGPAFAAARRLVPAALAILVGLLSLAAAASWLVSVRVTVDAPGSIEPYRAWPVRAAEAGRITEVLVEPGAPVKRGQVLLHLDSLPLLESLGRARAQARAAESELLGARAIAPVAARQQADRIAQAEARVTVARAHLRERMVESSLGTAVDSLLAAHVSGGHVVLDEAVAEVRLAIAEQRIAVAEQERLGAQAFQRMRMEAQRDELAGQVRSLELHVDRLAVRAPADGVVLTEQLERLPGAVIPQGEVLLEVGEPGRWRAVVFVSERDVDRIRVGDAVEVEVPAFRIEDRGRLQGVVRYVGLAPAAEGRAEGDEQAPASAARGRYRAIIELSAGPVAHLGASRLRPGFLVQAHVLTRRERIATLLWERLTGAVRDRI